MKVVKVLPKGQITLPKEIRKSLHIKEGDTLVIEKKIAILFLRKVKPYLIILASCPSQISP